MYVIGNIRKSGKMTGNGLITNEDYKPLTMTASKDISNHSLSKLSIEKCEFCDRVFNNRYDHMVHNAKHIIIPLIKQPIYQCPACLYCFISQIDLSRHNSEKHHIKVTLEDISLLLKNIIKKEPVVSQEITQGGKVDVKKRLSYDENLFDGTKLNGNDYSESDSGDIKREHEEEILQSIVAREPKIVCHKDVIMAANTQNIKEEKPQNDRVQLLQSLVKNERYIICANDINLNVKKETDEILKNIVQKEPVIVCQELPLAQTNDLETSRNLPSSGIRSKLVFEDDDDDIICLDEINSTETNNMSLPVESNTYPTNVNAIYVPNEEYTPSIHYDELKEEGIYSCKTCKKTFKNRFDVVIHETLHIGFRRSRYGHCNMCDKYIYGNYHNVNAHKRLRHQNERLRHQNEWPKDSLIIKKICKRCGLRYINYSKHSKNYHVFLNPNSEIESDNECNTNKVECNTSNVECNTNNVECNTNKSESNMSKLSNVSYVKICDVCYLFCKDRLNVKYKLIKVINEIGARQVCQSCNKQFFEIKLVKRIMTERYDRGEHKKKTKIYSNTDRLKNIQQRMKMMKYTFK